MTSAFDRAMFQTKQFPDPTQGGKILNAMANIGGTYDDAKAAAAVVPDRSIEELVEVPAGTEVGPLGGFDRQVIEAAEEPPKYANTAAVLKDTSRHRDVYKDGYDAVGPHIPVAEPAPGTWAATTAYSLAKKVNIGGKVLEVTTAGTSAGTIPTAPGSVGGTVTDGTVVWTRRT
ncbi:hypothetical protein SEA_SKOG_169 [Gordonia phage Skog]|uniref:Uncharacterized protein n=1 Tax=Gordonia phage Skog TaxID=2704033 RepID=A0A6G6XJN5_9CAUD|nr:hypothetical protein KHQ85_gp169 [Gordonia phage Skog]QIG58321.1 hypothetical protein SEA_SKOG_169 [Gordonia phage Skog]